VVLSRKAPNLPLQKERNKMALTKKITEGKEMYAGKAAMMKHEKKEPMKMEKKEGMMAKGGSVKKKPMKGVINKFIR
jgi:hypothetical protein